MNDHLHSAHMPTFHDRGDDARAAPAAALPVGDVCVRRDEAGFGIFNYRGEPVLDDPVSSCAEAARLAREIVAPWRGHVLVEDPSQG